MNRWADVSRVLDEVIDLAPDERAHRLRDVPADIATEVRALLDAHDRSADFLADATVTAPVAPGDRFGPWRVVAPIAAGGMGTVYRAERADDAFEMQAALKVLAAGLLTPPMIERFRDERQMLATLEHPHIARLLDGGIDETGRPYLVMELVDGAPITASAPALPIAARLAVFRDVAGAVQAAHRRLIVHRDIKPANVLVTRDGVVKLVDFGIARAAADRQMSPELQALTPEYASPEQRRGDAVGPASDVWALGALLFELIAGRRRASDDDRLAEDDLDAIVRRAMAPDPAARYGSAAELAADVERYQRGEPVEAGPRRWSYVARKFVARHRWGTGLAIAAALLLAATAAVAVWQAREATAARRVAERRLADVRELAGTLIFGVDERIASLPGSSDARRFFVGRGLAYLDRLLADGEPDPPLARQIASGYLRLGDILGAPGRFNLGDTAGAMSAYAKAEALAQTAVDRGQPSPALDDRRRLAAVHGRVAEVHLDARKPDAVARAAAAVNALDGVVPTADDVETGLAIAAAHFMLATAKQTLTSQSPLTDWSAALAIYDRLRARDPRSDEYRRNAALVHKYLAAYHRGQKDDRAAAHHLEQALAIDRERAAADPANPQVRLDYTFGLTQSAELLSAAGDLPAAQERYEEAVRVRQALADEDPVDVRARGRLAYAQVQLGDILARRGEGDRARDRYNAALQNAGRVLTASPEAVNTQVDRLAAWVGLASVTGNCAYLRRAEAGLAALSSRAPQWIVTRVGDAGTRGKCSSAGASAVRAPAPPRR